ncbi:efflux RND transporter periplasmic adaptor subunit [Xanthobacter autotrophicus]|uniref:efflux RND transporter periplasmic adaptor subunit n=1 Tax=Xanthobacter autotrophicus TaxID=280 RepID=UPI0037265D77
MEHRLWLVTLAATAMSIAAFAVEAQAGDGPPAPAPATIPVEIATADRRDVPIFLTDLGTVEPYNQVTIRSRVDGALQQVLFKEGNDVRQGDLLAEIDPRTFQASLDQARARLDQDTASLANARLILNRDAQLVARDFVSVETADTQRSTVAQLEAQVEQDKALIVTAETELSYTRILAPIDGRAGLRLVDVGNIVHASDPGGLVVINQVNPIAVISTLPERDVPAIRAALAAGPVEVEALSREDGTVLDIGTVQLMDNAIDPKSGTLKLKSVFPNAGDQLWPGQFIDAKVHVTTLKGVVTVPAGAIQRGPDGTFVYRVAPDQTVSPAAVRTGPISEGVAVIESGLAEGTRVVSAGQYRLSAGARVADVPSSQAQ